MKAKIFSLILLTALLSVSFVAAVQLTDITLVSKPSEVSNDKGSFDIVFDLTNDGTAGNLYYNLSNFTSSQTGLDFSFDKTTIPGEIVETITATISFNSGQTGTITGNINVGNTVTDTDKTLPFSVLLTEAVDDEPEKIKECSTLPSGDLSIEIDDIQVVEGFGDDEDYWYPFDEIEIDIVVENENSDYDIEDIKINWGLYNKNTGKWYIDDDEKDFDLKDDEEETITINFKLDDDIEDLEDDLVFYVWAEGTLDDDDDGVDLCASDSEDIEINIDDDFVIVTDIEILESVQCGQEFQITGEVWNIGSDDQDDVYITISNYDLGLNEQINIGDIDSFDSEKFSKTITIPQDAEEMTYYIDFRVYDEDNDIYENDEDDESVITKLVKVEGNCKVVPKATVVATLESDAKTGKDITIKAVITNNGDEIVTYTLAASNYESWSTLKEVSPAVLVLESDESAEVTYKLHVKDDVAGLQSFNIEVKTGDSEKETLKQPVQITVEESTGFFSGLSGASIFEGDNWYLWGIGALNIILIIIIIVVAIRVARS